MSIKKNPCKNLLILKKSMRQHSCVGSFFMLNFGNKQKKGENTEIVLKRKFGYNGYKKNLGSGYGKEKNF